MECGDWSSRIRSAVDAIGDSVIVNAQKPYTMRRVLAWTAVIAWAVFIFFMSAKTASELNHGSGLTSLIKRWLADVLSGLLGRQVDVSPIGHFAEFLVFGALLANAFRCHVPLRKALCAAIAVASLYGVTDELHQMFVPGRSCDPADWLVDTVAAACACLFFWLVMHRRSGGGDLTDGSGASASSLES